MLPEQHKDRGSPRAYVRSRLKASLVFAGGIAEAPWFPFPGTARKAGKGFPRWILGLAAAALVAAVALHEARTSAFQSRLFALLARHVRYTVLPGPSDRIVFPGSGPWDRLLGYSRIPDFERLLEERGFRVTEQARFSEPLARLSTWGIAPPYREPTVGGLDLRDLRGLPLEESGREPDFFRSFDEIPEPVIRMLLFIENRELASPSDPRANPVVDWGRLARAAFSYAGNRIGIPVRLQGGSTLATQIEKYQHSPEGRTRSSLDKLRQMAGASLKVYREGTDTRAMRMEIVLDYLNSVPLAAAPGWGEAHGIGEGLRAWFGTDLERVRRDLGPDASPAGRALATRQVLALLCAAQAPTRYLSQDRRALEARMALYIDLMGKAGLLDPALARRMEAGPLVPPEGGKDPPPVPASRRKAGDAVRRDLARLLDLPNPYDLRHLDLQAETTLDRDLQERVLRLFERLRDPRFLQERGLRGDRLLSRGDPGQVVYSFLLLERTPRGDEVRVQADTLDQPLDLNEGMKLELGSTAKLRTVTHYLEVVADLHREFSGLNPASLEMKGAEARDPITRWAARTLAARPGLDLEAFLSAALDRTYSASPRETFFTGGGEHQFVNFERDEDGLAPTVREALARSINLAFIRLMRDLVQYHEARLPYDFRRVLADPASPDRRRLLEEAADDEAREILDRAYRSYRGLDSGAILSRLLGRRAASPRSLAWLYLAWHPGAEPQEVARQVREWGGGTLPGDVVRVIRSGGASRFTLADYAYLLKLHPLDVWCAGEALRDPAAGWEAIWKQSAAARRVASAWLFEARNRRAQDLRLRIRIERDAFERMTPYWRRLGFPFERLVPSLATAIGSSSDRPAALAQLMGILVNGGVRLPDLRVRELRFGEETPYHTVLENSPPGGERLLPAPVASAVLRALQDVVAAGTARRLAGVFNGAGGAPVAVGGKTGSGDNRFETFGPGGRLRSSRPVTRTATFVFYIGDRYFGVMTAFVQGTRAGDYRFTSALPVTLLGLLAPALNKRLATREAPSWDPGPLPPPAAAILEALPHPGNDRSLPSPVRQAGQAQPGDDPRQFSAVEDRTAAGAPGRPARFLRKGSGGARDPRAS